MKPRLVKTQDLLAWPVIGGVTGAIIGYWRGGKRGRRLLYTLLGGGAGIGVGFGVREGIHAYGKKHGWPQLYAIKGLKG